MKTQSPDTSPDAELVLLGMIRGTPISRRFAFVQSWTASMLEAGGQYIRQLYPQASEEEVRLLFIERQYGKELAGEIRQALHANRIQVTDTPDLQGAIRPLVKIFDDLDVPYALSGSLASSLYGFQRATLQIDFVAEIRQKHLPSFYSHLEDVYLFQREEIETALQQQTCFILVHLETLFKVKVTLAETGRQMFYRVKITLAEGDRSISALSPEQMILQLLEAYKRSGGRSDDLWYDLLGIAKIQDTALDLPFLKRQAEAPGVTDLLKLMLVDAGLRGGL